MVWFFILGGNASQPYCLGHTGMVLFNKKSNIWHAKVYIYFESPKFIVLMKSAAVSYIYFKFDIERPKLFIFVFFN
jgi:hypothetical protein